MQAGDVITAIDGTAIKDANSLMGVVARRAPGTTLTVNIDRQGTALNLPVVLAERPSFDDNAQNQQNGQPSQNGELQPNDLQYLLEQLRQLHEMRRQ